MKFKDLRIQKNIADQLLAFKKEGRLPHALLLHGPEGNGALAVALAWAQFLNCSAPEENDSCGTCPSCQKYQKLIHPELHFVFPVVKKDKKGLSEEYIDAWRELFLENPFFTLNQWLSHIKAENAQGQIYSEESIRIIHHLSLKAFESEYKTLIMWLPEKLHRTTANKLLKNLEEPPPKTIFILVSQNTSQVLPTILSRCQLIQVPLLKEEEMKNLLTARLGITEKQAATASRISGGSISRALEALGEDKQQAEFMNHFRELMRLAFKDDMSGIIDWAEESSRFGREKQKAFLSYSLRLLRENLALTLTRQNRELVYISEQEEEFVYKFHPFIHENNVHALSYEMEKAHRHIGKNGNARIVFGDLGLKIAGRIARRP